MDRHGERCGSRDTGHPSGSPAGAHRPSPTGEPTNSARRLRDRPAIRLDDPRAPARGANDMTTKTDLGKLEASGLIQVAAVQPELEYLFRHALVQDAAYSSLLKQDRRSLHELAAEALLAMYPDRGRELAAVIAMHFDQAGDARRAAEQFVIAGEHALERFATREAVHAFARALELMPADDPHIDLRMRAAIGVARSGWTFMGLGGGIDQLERALAAGADRADRRLVADAYFWLAFLRRMSGETPETSPAMRVAMEQAEKVGIEVGDPAAQAIPK